MKRYIARDVYKALRDNPHLSPEIYRRIGIGASRDGTDPQRVRLSSGLS